MGPPERGPSKAWEQGCAQQNHEQGEKEKLAAGFACVLFHELVCGYESGRVETEHIGSQNIEIKALLRLQEIILKLQKHLLSMKHRPGMELQEEEFKYDSNAILFPRELEHSSTPTELASTFPCLLPLVQGAC